LTFPERSDKISQKHQKTGKKSRSFPKTPGFMPGLSPQSSKNQHLLASFLVSPAAAAQPSGLSPQTMRTPTEGVAGSRGKEKPPTPKG
jgi:hypothetical protein